MNIFKFLSPFWFLLESKARATKWKKTKTSLTWGLRLFEFMHGCVWINRVNLVILLMSGVFSEVRRNLSKLLPSASLRWFKIYIFIQSVKLSMNETETERQPGNVWCCLSGVKDRCTVHGYPLFTHRDTNTGRGFTGEVCFWFQEFTAISF